VASPKETFQRGVDMWGLFVEWAEQHAETWRDGALLAAIRRCTHICAIVQGNVGSLKHK
ncbi:hypothetical protein NDU88_006486, partial [Pleurodeles waltl]